MRNKRPTAQIDIISRVYLPEQQMIANDFGIRPYAQATDRAMRLSEMLVRKKSRNMDG